MFCFPKLCFSERFCGGVGTRRTAQEPMATEVRDMESQIVKQQPPSFWSRFFSCFYPRVRSRPACEHQWSDYSADHIEVSQISNSAITNNYGKATCHMSLSHASDHSESLVLDETQSTAITEMDGNVASIETRFITSAPLVYTNMTGQSGQHIIFPPPKVHTANSLNAVGFQEFVPVKSSALASSLRCNHENSGRGEDQRQVGRGEHSALWEIFQGPPPPKSLSAKERLRARYAQPKEFPVVESASIAVLKTHGLDQDFVPEISLAPASRQRYTHENCRQDKDQRQTGKGEHSALWEIFKGPPPPQSLSAKERLRARYAPKEFPVVESTSVAVLKTHSLDQDVEPPYLPARQSWVGYHRYT